MSIVYGVCAIVGAVCLVCAALMFVLVAMARIGTFKEMNERRK